MGDKAIEIASDVNKEIEFTTSQSRVCKIHFLPERFLEKVDKNPKYIVYIYRDVRDVLVSSFFYYKYKDDRKYAMSKISLSYFINPTTLIRWIKTRYEFSKFITKFIERGTGTGKYGTWNNHINQWAGYLYDNKNRELKFCFVSYDRLLFDREGEILRIFKGLRLQFSYYAHLKKCIEEESFQKRKEEIVKAEEHELTFGKKFNIRFLRSGKSGDWKNFLTEKQLNYILSKSYNQVSCLTTGF